MDVTRIATILVKCLGQVDKKQNPLPGSEVVDVWIPIVLRTDKVHEYASEMIELLKEWPSEIWGQPIPTLGEEINYLVVGAVLDSQQHAFMLFAFGKLLDWWDIIDPQTVLRLDKNNGIAQRMAGMGMVAINGYRPKVAA